MSWPRAVWVSATLEQTFAARDAPYEALEAYLAGEHCEPSPQSGGSALDRGITVFGTTMAEQAFQAALKRRLRADSRLRLKRRAVRQEPPDLTPMFAVV